MSMYLCDDSCQSNEKFAQQIQDGHPEAAALLLSQNEGHLTVLARSYCEQYSSYFLVDDPRQEGVLALLDAEQQFDPSKEAKLLTTLLPPLKRLCRTVPPKVLFLRHSHWTATTSCGRWLFSVPHMNRTLGQIF